MRPPICEICGKEFNPENEGALLYFKETEKGRIFDKRSREEGIVGHPPDAGWFCEEHVEKAKKLKRLTLSEAIKRFRV